MTLAEHDAEVQRLEGLISSKSARANNALKTAANQEAWLKGRKCRGTKSKKAQCEEKNAQVVADNKYLRSSAAQLKKQVAEHRAALQKLIDDRSEIVASSAEVSRLLAEQGKTQEAVRTSAELEGQAAAERQRMLGEAESMKVLQDAEADASNKKLIGLVGAGIGVVIIIVVGVIAYKKFKKK